MAEVWLKWMQILTQIKFIKMIRRNTREFLKSKGNFKNGQRDGYWEYYFEDGRISERGRCKNGEEEGLWEEFFKSGKIKNKIIYKNGNLISFESFHFNGNRKEEGGWKNGKPWNLENCMHGIWKYFNQSGVQIREESWKNGKKDGIWKNFDNDGELYSLWRLKNDKLTELSQYHKKGRIAYLKFEGKIYKKVMLL